MNRVIYFIITFIFCTFNQSADAAKNETGFSLPKYEKVVLKNGLTLYLMEQHEVPLISVTTAIKAGAVMDGPQLGIAGLTVDALNMGIEDYDKQALEDLFDFHGARISSSIAPDSASLSMSLAAKDLDRLLPIYLEMINAPNFAEKDTNKLLSLHIQGLDRSLERPNSIVHRYFYRMLFGDHVYGNPTDGNKASVSDIKPKDLQAFHKAHYQPSNMAISLVGDFNLKKLKKKISKLTKKWPSGNPSIVDIAPVDYVQTGNRIVLVNKGDALETSIRIGGKGISRSNPDYVELSVINTILGGRFTAWLLTALRTDTGLTYSASSRFRPLKEDGAFFISTFTNTPTTFETLDLALSTYQRLLDGEIDQETLTSAQNYVVGLFPPKFEKTSDLSSLLTQMYIYDFDESYVDDFEKNVKQLTLERANSLVKKYFPKDDLVIVLIGKGEEIREKAGAYGKVYELDIKDPIPKKF